MGFVNAGNMYFNKYSWFCFCLILRILLRAAALFLPNITHIAQSCSSSFYLILRILLRAAAHFQHISSSYNLIISLLREQAKENRIYIRVEFTRKKCKTAILLTVSILQVYFTYLRYITFWALEHHFIENLKLILKENQIMK